MQHQSVFIFTPVLPDMLRGEQDVGQQPTTVGLHDPEQFTGLCLI
jgi:hypothetical protein